MAAKQPELVQEKTGGKFPFKVKDVILNEDQVLSENHLLKKRGVKVALTQEQIQEMIKCASDPIYFIENYVRIISIDDGLVPFKLYPYQRQMIENYHNNRYNITVTLRQSGKTTTVAAFILWHAIFKTSQNCAVLANKEAQSQEIMERIAMMVENLPYFLMPGVVIFNKMRIKFDNSSNSSDYNGSNIFGAASGSSSIRGKSVSLLYLDEMAFLAQDEDFFASTYPVITSGKKSKVIITSTPNGSRGVFYRIWKECDQGTNKNGYKGLKITWKDHPYRDQAWCDDMIATQGINKFLQEFNCEFLGSANSLISGDVLERLQFLNPINNDKYINIYEEPQEGHAYVTIVDPSEGVGRDYSVITVIDVTAIPYRQVCVYANNTIDAIILPTTIYSIASKYNNSLVLIEGNNDIGGQVNYQFYYELEYENTISTSADKDGLSVRVGGKGARPGVRTNKKTKAMGCANLKTILENNKLIICDDQTISELGTFVEKGTTYEADDDCHDDRVMTLVLFSWLIKQPFFTDFTDNDITKNILERQMETMQNDIMPFGFIFDQSAQADMYPSMNRDFNTIIIVDPSQISFDDWMNS